MACERWCFNRSCDGAPQRWLYILLLAFCVLGNLDWCFADNELNRYHYEVEQSRSLVDYGPIEFSFLDAKDGVDDEAFERYRRAADDKPAPSTEQPAREEPQQPQQQQQQQQLQQQQQQKQQQPQQQQAQPPSQQQENQRQQLEAASQQPQPQLQLETQTQQQQPQPAVNSTTYTATNVADSAVHTTESSAGANSTSFTTRDGKQETGTISAAKQETSTKPSILFVRKNPATKESSETPASWTNVTSNDTNESTESNSNNNNNNNPLKNTENVVEPTTEEKEDSDGNIGDISISKFSDWTDKTLSQHNITKTKYDTHQYYNSTFIVDEAVGKKYWVDIDKHPDLKINHLLSKSHYRAATVKLKFDFPFYGHKVRNITIATGGFLYTGEYVHSWLAATQYIAPLMANFDTRLSNDSYVKYADNGTAFTVVWEKVALHDKPNAGAFTFQVTLHQNGDIVFVYAVIPLMVEHIEDKAHPVKVGLSDAYIMDRIVFFVRRKTIYEYHRVNFNRQDIKNWTLIYLNALPTCLEMHNCKDCLTKLKGLDCKWCSELNQCSTGTFRLRQDWLLKGCDVRMIKDVDNCPAQTTTCSEHDEQYSPVHHILHSEETVTVSEMNAKQVKPGSNALERSRDNMNMGVSGIIGILLVIGLVVGLVAWAAYAYRNPHSASGQMLIRYRPSQWSWRRGEARYTAATIHM